MKLYLLAAIVLTAPAVGQFIHANETTSQAKHDLVYQVCNRSRISPTTTETECGQLQDKLKIEFLCSQRNNLVSNYCWTEDNFNLGDN